MSNILHFLNLIFNTVMLYLIYSTLSLLKFSILELFPNQLIKYPDDFINKGYRQGF